MYRLLSVVEEVVFKIQQDVDAWPRRGERIFCCINWVKLPYPFLIVKN